MPGAVNIDYDFMNYAQHGASKTKNVFKLSFDRLKTADEDIGLTKDTLTARLRELFMGNTISTSAIKKFKTSVVGKGLKMKSTLNTDILKISEEEAMRIEKAIEFVWEMWAESKECDFYRESNFYQLQALAFLTMLIDGDCFTLLPFKKYKGDLFELKVQLIDSIRCKNPYSNFDKDIKNGIEKDKNGVAVACYFYVDEYDSKSIRVPIFGEKTGRRNILILKGRERIGQRRGVPLLAPVIESLFHLTQYSLAELTNAVISALFTAFIETSPTSDLSTPPGESSYENVEEEQEEDGDLNITLGNGNIQELPKGKTVKFANPSRPNANFDAFFSAMTKHIAAALELPVEVLLNSFNSNYSASKAAMNEAWAVFESKKADFISDFCQPIFEEFMDEIVYEGYLDLKGYKENPFIRRAYLKAEWYGTSQGQLDPVKEVTASILKIKHNLSTKAKECLELNGTDYESNAKQRKAEKEMEEKYGIFESDQKRK